MGGASAPLTALPALPLSSLVGFGVRVYVCVLPELMVIAAGELKVPTLFEPLAWLHIWVRLTR